MSVGRNPPSMQRDLDGEHMSSTRGYRQGPDLNAGAVYPGRLSMQGSGQREMIDTLGETLLKLDAKHRARLEYFAWHGLEVDDKYRRDRDQIIEIMRKMNRLENEYFGLRSTCRPRRGGRGHRDPRGNPALSGLVSNSRPRAGMENERIRPGNGSRHEDDIASATRGLSRLGVKSRESSNMARETRVHLTHHPDSGDHADAEADDPSYESRHGRMGSRRETAEAGTTMPPGMAHPSRLQDPPDAYADDDDHHLSETGRAGAEAVNRCRREAAETTRTRMPGGMGASTHRRNMTDEEFDFSSRGSRHVHRQPWAGHGRGFPGR